MCVLATPEFSKFNAWTESRRSHYQVKVALYDVPKMIEKEPETEAEKEAARTKKQCLGCITCPFSFEAAGIDRSPKSAAELLDELKRKTKPHHREILSCQIETFLSPMVAEPIAAAARTLPLRYNLITKRPDVALESLMTYPDLWKGVDHHIQVVVLKDGIFDAGITRKVLTDLVEHAQSVSIRIDPFMPGYTDIEQVSQIVDDAAHAGVSWITAAVYHPLAGQIDRLPGDSTALRNSYTGEFSKTKPLAPVGAFERQQLQLLEQRCRANGLTLGVWSSDETLVQRHEDHDGCSLRRAADIRGRYEAIERSRIERQAMAGRRRNDLRRFQKLYQPEQE